jgi:raffinose/stachyose/melibiose transport system permease protein
MVNEPLPKTHRRQSLRDQVGLLFITPALVFFSVFLMVPVVGSFIISLTSWEGFSYDLIRFVGFENYINFAHDKTLHTALINNLMFILFAVSGEVVLALFLAVLLEKQLPGSRFFRGVYFMPNVVSTVVIGILFGFIFSSGVGLINPFLNAVGLGRLARPWLGDRRSAMGVLIVIYVWQNFGMFTILFVAGLKAIDDELYQSAQMDGANAWQRFCYISLPSLHRVTTVVILLAVINSLKLFELVYMLTFGGPAHGTEVLTTWIYYVGFTINKMGYGSAVSVLLLLIAALVTAVQLKVSAVLQKE